MKKIKAKLSELKNQSPNTVLDLKKVKKIKGGYGAIVIVEEDIF